MTDEPLRLRYYPDPVLARRAEPIARVDGRLKTLARAMFDLMYSEGGIGLAAPQVGRLERLFVVNLVSDPEQGTKELVFLNPTITSSTGRTHFEEGCLSLPGVRAVVERSARVKVSALDLAGKPFEIEAEDLLARCIQHEVDHLDGILFVKRLSTTEQMGLRKSLKELERKYGDGERDGRGRGR